MAHFSFHSQLSLGVVVDFIIYYLRSERNVHKWIFFGFRLFIVVVSVVFCDIAALTQDTLSQKSILNLLNEMVFFRWKFYCTETVNFNLLSTKMIKKFNYFCSARKKMMPKLRNSFVFFFVGAITLFQHNDAVGNDRIHFVRHSRQKQWKWNFFK